MAEYGETTNHTFTSAADLSAKQYLFMEQSTSTGKVTSADGIGDICVGVLQNDPAAANRAACVAVAGITKVVAGATIAIGDKLCTNASGKAIVANSGNVFVMGEATVSGASDEVIQMTISKYQRTY